MAIVKVISDYDGRLPVFNVVREVCIGNNCGIPRNEVIRSFDTYEEADIFCDELVKSGKAADSYGITPCGEEDPASHD